MKRIRFRKQWGSHLPVLIRAMELTNGPVLELGSGLYSTPFLHWECLRKGRRLVTLESEEDWFRLVEQYKTEWHDVKFVRDWDKEDVDYKWSVVLVDHVGERRGKDMLRIRGAQIIVVHDAEGKYLKEYGIEKASKEFVWKWRYKEARPFTMVVSNTWNLSGFHV